MGPAPWDGAVANPQKHAFPHLRYHAETDRCAFKGVDISRVSQKLGCTGAAPSPLSASVRSRTETRDTF